VITHTQATVYVVAFISGCYSHLSLHVTARDYFDDLEAHVALKDVNIQHTDLQIWKDHVPNTQASTNLLQADLDDLEDKIQQQQELLDESQFSKDKAGCHANTNSHI